MKENNLNKNISWDEYFISMAFLASTKSKDESTHIGSVIVGVDNEIVSTGMNGFVRGINDNLKVRQERPEKYFWMEHSERNAIYNAARIGVSLKNCKIYITATPCMDCARAIVQSGISEVIVDTNQNYEKTQEWSKHSDRSLILFKEAGVKFRYFKGEYVKPYKLNRGKKEYI